MPNLNAGRGAKRTETAAVESPLSQPLLNEALAACGEACSKGFSQWQDEVARFAQTRLQRNSALAEGMARCRDLKDVAGLHQEWLKDASQDYLQQSARMVSLAGRLTQEWMGPMVRLWGVAATGAMPPRED